MMNKIQNFVILMLVALTSCGVQNRSVIIKNETLREKLEDLEANGTSELSFYVRSNESGSPILVIANHNLGKCDIYKSGGIYKSMTIQLFAESEEIIDNCKNHFLFPQKSECVSPEKDEIEIAPDSDMIYEYEITKSSLKAIGK